MAARKTEVTRAEAGDWLSVYSIISKLYAYYWVIGEVGKGRIFCLKKGI